MKNLFLYMAMNCFFLSAVKVPIDIVYTWVDGNDKEWLALKEHYLALELAKTTLSRGDRLVLNQEYQKIQRMRALPVDAMQNSRFADHEELRYSLRSVMQYAPWVNHIYIVSMNQKPAWFVPHPKITFVNHTDIFKNSADLPTFNSHAIESNLHRIPGLSDHFIYFNDDVFLGAPAASTDFFTNDNKVVVLFERGLTVSPSAAINATAFRKAWRNTNAYLDAHYKKEKRHRLAHAPFALRTSCMDFSEKEFSFIFDSNSAHKFRADTDYNMANGLLQYHWLYHNKVKPIWNYPRFVVPLYDDAMIEDNRAALEKIYALRPASFCIQDMMEEESPATAELLHTFLERYYPERCPWEKNA